jgi:2-iminobutanoate/2-iminopropanoate deaminase
MTERKIISTDDAPAAIGPYSQAVVAGGFVFCSGQIGLTASGEMVQGGVEAEVRQSLTNLRAVLAAAGSSLEQVVQATLFVAHMEDFSKVNAIYAESFDRDPPARACVEASALPKGALFEICCQALVG